MNKIHFLLLGSLILSLLLFGCTENTSIPGIPFTVGQFISRTTNLDYNSFMAGDYNAAFLIIDGNRIGITYDINGVTPGQDWNSIVDFPIGCGTNEAVQIIGHTLTCIHITDINAVHLGDPITDLNNNAGYITGVDINNLVPYHGANRAIDLNNQDVNNVNNLTVNGTTRLNGQLIVDDGVYPSSWIKRQTSATSSVVVANALEAISNGDMQDYFGAGLEFRIQDNAGVSNPIGQFSVVRRGDDNSGAFNISTYNKGDVTIKMSILPDGNVGIGTIIPNDKLDVIGGISATSFKQNGFPVCDSNNNCGYASLTDLNKQSPAGNNTEIQFNDNNTFGSNINFTYNKTTNTQGFNSPGIIQGTNRIDIKNKPVISLNALRFDGTQNYVKFPSNTNLNLSFPFTIEGWIYLTKYQADQVIISHTTDDGIEYPDYVLLVDSNKASFLHRNISGSGVQQILGTTNVTLNTWHNIAFTTDANGDGRLYLDGHLEATGTFIDMGTISRYTFVGMWRTSYFTPYGDLTQIRLTSNTLYYGDYTPATSYLVDANTIAYWNFDSNSGDTLYDATLNANDGTLYGTPKPIWVTGLIAPSGEANTNNIIKGYYYNGTQNVRLSDNNSITSLDGNALVLNGEYPTSDNQVLAADINGQYSWRTISGGGAGGNPFNQDLNTTDSPIFSNLTVTNYLNVGGIKDTYVTPRLSIDPNTRELWNTNFYPAFNWDTGIFKDVYNITEADLGNRTLNNTYGLPVFDWQNGTWSYGLHVGINMVNQTLHNVSTDATTLDWQKQELKNGAWSDGAGHNFITEAPDDGNQYARDNNSWIIVTSGGIDTNCSEYGSCPLIEYKQDLNNDINAFVNPLIPNITNLVPYQGANADLNLGTHTLTGNISNVTYASIGACLRNSSSGNCSISSDLGRLYTSAGLGHIALDYSTTFKPYNVYSLPSTDGTSNQVQATNGAGTLSWQSIAYILGLNNLDMNTKSITNITDLNSTNINATTEHLTGNLTVDGNITATNCIYIGTKKCCTVGNTLRCG